MSVNIPELSEPLWSKLLGAVMALLVYGVPSLFACCVLAIVLTTPIRSPATIVEVHHSTHAFDATYTAVEFDDGSGMIYSGIRGVVGSRIMADTGERRFVWEASK